MDASMISLWFVLMATAAVSGQRFDKREQLNNDNGSPFGESTNSYGAPSEDKSYTVKFPVTYTYRVNQPSGKSLMESYDNDNKFYSSGHDSKAWANIYSSYIPIQSPSEYSQAMRQLAQPSFQEFQPISQDSQPSYQYSQPSYQNSDPSYGYRQPSYQYSEPSNQYTQSSYQGSSRPTYRRGPGKIQADSWDTSAHIKNWGTKSRTIENFGGDLDQSNGGGFMAFPDFGDLPFRR